MGVSGDIDAVVANFDVTGFTTNYQRLPAPRYSKAPVVATGASDMH